MPSERHRATILMVDDNIDLLHFFERLIAEVPGWNLQTAESAARARRVLAQHRPDVALLDYMLPDGNGVELGVQLRQNAPQMQVIVMTRSVLPPEEEALCEEHNFLVLVKPFRASDVMSLIRKGLKSPDARPSRRHKRKR